MARLTHPGTLSFTNLADPKLQNHRLQGSVTHIQWYLKDMLLVPLQCAIYVFQEVVLRQCDGTDKTNFRVYFCVFLDCHCFAKRRLC